MNFPHLWSPESTVMFGTQEVSHHHRDLFRALGSRSVVSQTLRGVVPLTLHSWPDISLMPPTHPIFFSSSLIFLLTWLSSFHGPTRPSAGANGPPSPSAHGLLLNQCLTKGWVSPTAREEEPERLFRCEEATRKAGGRVVHIPCPNKQSIRDCISLPLIVKTKPLTSGVYSCLRLLC